MELWESADAVFRQRFADQTAEGIASLAKEAALLGEDVESEIPANGEPSPDRVSLEHASGHDRKGQIVSNMVDKHTGHVGHVGYDQQMQGSQEHASDNLVQGANLAYLAIVPEQAMPMDKDEDAIGNEDSQFAPSVQTISAVPQLTQQPEDEAAQGFVY